MSVSIFLHFPFLLVFESTGSSFLRVYSSTLVVRKQDSASTVWCLTFAWCVTCKSNSDNCIYHLESLFELVLISMQGKGWRSAQIRKCDHSRYGIDSRTIHTIVKHSPCVLCALSYASSVLQNESDQHLISFAYITACFWNCRRQTWPSLASVSIMWCLFSFGRAGVRGMSNQCCSTSSPSTSVSFSSPGFRGWCSSSLWFNSTAIGLKLSVIIWKTVWRPKKTWAHSSS